MSSARLYRRYIKLCEAWGVDSTKQGRDLGEHIRARVAAAFNQGELSKIPDLEDCEKKLESLERIASNKYYRESDASLPTSTGATREECQAIISNEGIQAADDLYQSSYWTRLKLRWDAYRLSKNTAQKDSPAS